MGVLHWDIGTQHGKGNMICVGNQRTKFGKEFNQQLDDFTKDGEKGNQHQHSMG
jgi:hypothetical protein